MPGHAGCGGLEGASTFIPDAANSGCEDIFGIIGCAGNMGCRGTDGAIGAEGATGAGGKDIL